MNDNLSVLVDVFGGLSIAEIVAYLAAPTWLGRLSFLPLGITRNFVIPEAAHHALTVVSEQHRAGYRDALERRVDLSRIEVPKAIVAEDAVCIPRLDRNELTVRVPFRWFGFNRSLGVARVAFSFRANEASVRTTFTPVPMLSMLVGGLMAFGEVFGRYTTVHALLMLGLFLAVAIVNALLSRLRLLDATRVVLDQFEPYLLEAGRHARVVSVTPAERV